MASSEFPNAGASVSTGSMPLLTYRLYAGVCTVFLSSSKGQLISECPSGVFKSTKKQEKQRNEKRLNQK
jgi:hypothetical protein